MGLHKQKRPTVEGSGTSESIHLDKANDPYFSMIFHNEECALFCREVLKNYDELLNLYWVGDPIIEKHNRLGLYLTLAKLDNEERI